MKIIAAFVVGLTLAGVLSAAPAQALNQHSFVSSLGNDANACTLTAPCRHLQAALTATLSGGEIAILDTAGYNGGATVTITQAVSIVNPGGFEAAIAPPSGGTGIVISAGTNDAVSLRGLSIDGAGIGVHGIQFNTGASLTVENCVIRHMAGDGIDFLPNGSSNLAVSNTVASDNAGSGIVVSPSGSGIVTAVFNHVEVNNNVQDGIDAFGNNSTGTVKATVVDSIIAGNANIGLEAFTQPGEAPTTIMLYHSVAANNGIGLRAIGDTGATLIVFQTMVTGNGSGWTSEFGGTMLSYGNNAIDKNAADQDAPTSLALK